MYKLTSKQAQHIVNKMMKDIPYNINIMNEKGVIIGTGKKDRLGTLHTGAVQALKSGRMITITENSKNVRKGTNEPIVINGDIVGVIGISGEPDEVMPFCRLVKTTVSLLIEQEVNLKDIEQASRKKSTFLKSVLNESHQYSKEIIKAAKEYDLDLTRKTAVLLIEQGPKKESPKYPTFMEGDYTIIMVQNQSEIQSCIQVITKECPASTICIGAYVENVSVSYNQALDAKRIKGKLRLNKNIIFYKDIALLAEINQLNLSKDLIDQPAKETLKNSHELMETLISFIRNNCNISLTASELHIHRNTLQYRLNKIRDITGNDPKQILDLFKLISIVIR